MFSVVLIFLEQMWIVISKMFELNLVENLSHVAKWYRPNCHPIFGMIQDYQL